MRDRQAPRARPPHSRLQAAPGLSSPCTWQDTANRSDDERLPVLQGPGQTGPDLLSAPRNRQKECAAPDRETAFPAASNTTSARALRPGSRPLREKRRQCTQPTTVRFSAPERDTSSLSSIDRAPPFWAGCTQCALLPIAEDRWLLSSPWPKRIYLKRVATENLLHGSIATSMPEEGEKKEEASVDSSWTSHGLFVQACDSVERNFRGLPCHSQVCLPKSPDDEESTFSNGEMVLSEICRSKKRGSLSSCKGFSAMLSLPYPR